MTDKSYLIEKPLKATIEEFRIVMSPDGQRVYQRALAFFWVTTLAFFGSTITQCMKQQSYRNEYFEEEEAWSVKDVVVSDPWAFLSLVNYLSASITLLVLRSRLLTSQHNDQVISKSLKAFMCFSIFICWMFMLGYVILGFLTCYIEVPPPDMAPIASIMITGAFMFFIIGVFAAIDLKPSDTVIYPAVVHSV